MPNVTSRFPRRGNNVIETFLQIEDGDSEDKVNVMIETQRCGVSIVILNDQNLPVGEVYVDLNNQMIKVQQYNYNGESEDPVHSSELVFEPNTAKSMYAEEEGN